MAVTPIFLLSLPRSGSTFLQKILMSHPEIASTAEPWFLLPLCHMREKHGVFSSYGHIQSVNAFKRIEKDCNEAFIDNLIAEFAKSVYTQYTKNQERYFLDKTPRYYHILEDLIRIFPDAKFIVLLRNPISVFASSITGLRNNSIRRLDHLDRDLYQGPEQIARFVEKQQNRVHVIRYEDLLTDPEECIENICKYLDLDHTGNMIDKSFAIKLAGHGDHLGARTYKKLTNTQDKWKTIINTPCRKSRISRFLKKYSTSYLRIGKYDQASLIDDLNAHKTTKMGLMEYLYLVEEGFARLYKVFLERRYGR